MGREGVEAGMAGVIWVKAGIGEIEEMGFVAFWL